VPAEALGWRLDADLDAILMKALRKEPSARYGTAVELATDVRAWLDGMPVAARRGNLRYKAANSFAAIASPWRFGAAGRFFDRRSDRRGMAGHVANEERRRAEESAADLRQLSNSLLSELDEAIKELPGSTGAQKLLVTRVLEHLDRTAKDSTATARRSWISSMRTPSRRLSSAMQPAYTAYWEMSWVRAATKASTTFLVLCRPSRRMLS
jgi:hypothetical protein